MQNKAEDNTPESWAEKEKEAQEQARLDQKERERQRLEYEEAERQRKLEERENAEKLRLEAERHSYYVQLEKINFPLLALTGYPTDTEIHAAKRSRTLWYVILGLALFLFLLSLFKLTYAWVGGLAGGLAFVVWFTHGLKIINFFPSLTNYSHLLSLRRKLKRQLLEYIQQLEGNKSFMHKLYPLVEYNQRLSAKKYRRLVHFSMVGQLMANLKTLEDTEIYHDYMQEAFKAYKEYLHVKEEEKLAQARLAEENEIEQTQTDAEEPETNSAEAIEEIPEDTASANAPEATKQEEATPAAEDAAASNAENKAKTAEQQPLFTEQIAPKTND